MGLRVHEKPGKLIWPTKFIEWIGWAIDSDEMIVSMTNAKAMKGVALCKDFVVFLTNGGEPLAKQCME